jgi:hypothetical protein
VVEACSVARLNMSKTRAINLGAGRSPGFALSGAHHHARQNSAFRVEHGDVNSHAPEKFAAFYGTCYTSIERAWLV